MKPGDRLRVSLLLSGLLAPALAQTGKRWREAGATGDPRFVVYYGTQDQPALSRYDVVVLDSDIDAAIPRRLARRSLALGYLSAGEVHMGRAWAADLERQGLLLGPNPKWRDARFIDVRDARWKARVLDDLVPALLARGFTGLFLDTLDDAAHLESVDPRRFAGMQEAAVDLVRALRQRFTQLPIMVNRGYSLLPRIVPEIDMLLGESVHSTWDAALAAYVPVEPAAVRWQTERLHEARRLRPELSLFSLDYWSPDDPHGIGRIYAQAQGNGFTPYVATFDLTRIVPWS
jgi:polysaccharide biosynthesis protein PelA